MNWETVVPYCFYCYKDGSCDNNIPVLPEIGEVTDWERNLRKELEEKWLIS